MILSDFDLENMVNGKRLVITPFEKEIIRENGIDLRLSGDIARHNEKLDADFVLDPSNPEHIAMEYVVEKNQDRLIIGARTQVLLSTIEYVKMPDNLIGFVELRSTWARHGLIVPPTIIDVGFEGTITLEVFNSSMRSMMLKPGVRFAHVIFATTLSSVKNSYAGAYSGQSGVRLPKVL